MNNWKVLQSLKLDKNQVLVFDGPDPQRDPREPSDEQRIALITRLATASRSAGFDADKKFTPEDLRRMENNAKSQAETTHEEVDEVVEWIIANESNGDFSRDAWELMDRIPIMNRRIGIIRTNAGYPCILVCGIVRDLIAQVCIYLTTYRNVIGISVPHTPDKSVSPRRRAARRTRPPVSPAARRAAPRWSCTPTPTTSTMSPNF